MYIEKLPKVWQEQWVKSGFETPSLIQEKTFEVLKDKEDLLAISPTGSGKTLAYLLPLLQHVKKGEGNQLIVLLSSQELALQVANVAKIWGRLIELNVQTIIGGANSNRQIDALKKRPEVIIGTPGRIYELIRAKKIQLMNVETIVLDEADSLIESNSINLAESIISYVPKDFQLAFFSATGRAVEEKAQELVGADLFLVDVTKEDQSKGEVVHQFLNVPVRRKIDTLRSLAHIKGMQAIVFFNKMGDLGNAEEKLLYLDLPIASLASDQDKLTRKAALDRFKEGKISLLLT
ncbi:MAG: DEAD/DEAH box helicase, partial [Streptococcaceae bacterium]|nr:DEAD/DEAH box helicase [Streptococcaceae bacterium]